MKKTAFKLGAAFLVFYIVFACNSKNTAFVSVDGNYRLNFIPEINTCNWNKYENELEGWTVASFGDYCNVTLGDANFTRKALCSDGNVTLVYSYIENFNNVIPNIGCNIIVASYTNLHTNDDLTVTEIRIENMSGSCINDCEIVSSCTGLVQP